MQYLPLLPQETSTKKPRSAISQNPGAAFHNFIREELKIETWLLLGACLQAVLFCLPVRPIYQFGPPFIAILIKVIDNMLMVLGWTKNRYAVGSLHGKFSAIFPNPDGTFERDDSSFPGGDKVAVFLLNAKSNHPLGHYAPGFRELGAYFESMMKDMEANAADYGFLGAKQWKNTDERTASSEFMTILYFRDLDGIHRFAHAKAHRDGWDWFSKVTKNYPYMGISHEGYEAPAGNWETIYANMQPSGFATASVPVKGKSGETEWVRTVVDASRGKLRTHAGRKGVASGAENVEKYGEEPYDPEWFA